MGDGTTPIQDEGDNARSPDFPRHPPRLSAALFWATPGMIPKFKTKLQKIVDDADEDDDRNVRLTASASASPDEQKKAYFEGLSSLLEHIAERLSIGLEEAWLSRWGYDCKLPLRGTMDDDQWNSAFQSYCDATLPRIGYDSPEERWARAFTESWVLAPYGGAAQSTLNNQNDARIFSGWPRVRSISIMCQEVCSYGALSRGIPPSYLLDAGPDGAPRAQGIMAGPNDGQLVFNPKGAGGPWAGSVDRARWFPGSVTKWVEHDLRPGDAIAGQAGTAGDFRHAAMILRCFPSGAADGAKVRLQAFDTGQLAGLGDTTTQDHDWLDEAAVQATFSSAPESQSGVGKLPGVTDAALRKGAEDALRALPLGFAQLVLTRRDGTVLYVSAMLPMWHREERYSVARYVWSLRDLPANDLIAYWVIYGATGEALLREIEREAAGPARTAEELYRASEPHPDFPPVFYRLLVCTSEPRVVRAIITKGSAWMDVREDHSGEKAEYEEEPAPHPGVTPQQRIGPTRAMQIAELGKGVSLRMPGEAHQWDFHIGPVKDPATLAREMCVPDDRHPEQIVVRDMRETKVRYFSGPGT